MRFVASILIGALGAVARFEAVAEVAGFKMHALGVTLMIVAAIGLATSLQSVMPRLFNRVTMP